LRGHVGERTCGSVWRLDEAYIGLQEFDSNPKVTEPNLLFVRRYSLLTMLCASTERFWNRPVYPLWNGSEARRGCRDSEQTRTIYLFRFKQFGWCTPTCSTWCIKPLYELAWCVISPRSTL